MYDNEKGLIFPSYPPIVIFANRHPLPSQERYIVANRILFSVKSRPESFPPRLFFPPSSNGSSPSKARFVPYSRDPSPWPVSSGRRYEREKSWETTKGIRQGYVAGDEKAAHVITFPVTTRCREQFILLSIPFLSTLLSPTSLVFLLLVVLGFFKSFVSLFFLQSFVSN